MKVCGQVMEVTLTVHGRERTFSEQELIAILEKHFSNETTEQVSTAKVAQEPTEGELFEVNPLGIDRSSFEKPRKDQRQACTRQIIQEAFAEVDKQPEKYVSPFYTLIPKKNWNGCKTVVELKEYAKSLGGLMADWVQQALEWAQRISNGESWESICNKTDTANWYRMIIWKNGYTRLVGGSRNCNFNHPASDVDCNDYVSVDRINCTVPLVVLCEK